MEDSWFVEVGEANEVVHSPHWRIVNSRGSGGEEANNGVEGIRGFELIGSGEVPQFDVIVIRGFELFGIHCNHNLEFLVGVKEGVVIGTFFAGFEEWVVGEGQVDDGNFANVGVGFGGDFSGDPSPLGRF